MMNLFSHDKRSLENFADDHDCCRRLKEGRGLKKKDVEFELIRAQRSRQQKYPNSIIRMFKRRLAEKLNCLSDVLEMFFLDFRVEKRTMISSDLKRSCYMVYIFA